jgi:IMP and pyridine-specific 5'-nucleotidase
MLTWSEPVIQALLDKAEAALNECITNLSLSALVIRKERAVGIVPTIQGAKFPRESLEETVLVVQKILEMSPVSKTLPFCAFNGGNDVFVDIGDKSWGVLVCQKYFGDRLGRSIEGKRTMHVGDQGCYYIVGGKSRRMRDLIRRGSRVYEGGGAEESLTVDHTQNLRMEWT